MLAERHKHGIFDNEEKRQKGLNVKKERRSYLRSQLV